jgi:hypothetical protein
MFSESMEWINKWKKSIWWISLLVFFSCYLLINSARFLENNLIQIDYIFLSLWIIFLIFPLFSEIDIAGIKLKKEFESLKTEIRDQMFSLRNEIHNTTSIQFNTSPFLPPSDEKLKEREPIYSSIFDSRKTGTSVKSPQPALIRIPEKNQFLFEVRFTLEDELKKLMKERFDYEFNEKRPTPIFQMVKFLFEKELLDIRIRNLISDILSICNRAVHNQIITDEQYEFVKKFYPEIIRSLKEI